MFLELDGTFWIQLINFAIFFAIVQVVFLRPVGEAIRKRREYIDGVKGDYDRYHHQVTTLQAEADEKRLNARRAAERSAAEARAAAQREAAELTASGTERATAIADEARAKVDAELAAARAGSPELAKQLASTLLERALGGSR